MTFKQYIEEMAGAYALVSCKDRNNPNFQIWGAASDLGCPERKEKILKMRFKGDKENLNGKARKKQ